MRSKKEVLKKLKTCKEVIQQYESMNNTTVSQRIIKKYELKFEVLAWCLGCETDDEIHNLYDSLLPTNKAY